MHSTRCCSRNPNTMQMKSVTNYHCDNKIKAILTIPPIVLESKCINFQSHFYYIYPPCKATRKNQLETVILLWITMKQNAPKQNKSHQIIQLYCRVPPTNKQEQREMDMQWSYIQNSHTVRQNYQSISINGCLEGCITPIK